MKKLLMMFALVFLFTLSGCESGYTIKYSSELADFSANYKVEIGDDYDLPVKEVPHYTFLGYYDKDGALFTDSAGKSLYSYTLEEDLELFARYEPHTYNIVFDLFEADNKRDFNNEMEIQYSDAMPELPPAEKEKHDLVGYEAIFNDGTSVVISNGVDFIEGFSKLNENYSVSANGEKITIKPIFEKHKLSMTFVYPKDGVVVTEEWKVYIETDIKEVAPTIVDSDGVVHQFAWRTQEQIDSGNINELYHGETMSGLTLYADELYVAYETNNSDIDKIYDFYSLDCRNHTITLPKIESSNSKVSIDMELDIKVTKSTEVLTINTYHKMDYNGISIEIEERNSDLSIVLNNDSNIYSATIRSVTGKTTIIDGRKLTDNQLLTITVNGSISFYGNRGLTGKHGTDYSSYSTATSQNGAYAGEKGIDGGNGASCINATNVQLNIPTKSSLGLVGGSGGRGGNGGSARATNLPGYYGGSYGGGGGAGGDGANALIANHLIINVEGSLTVYGGDGGDGGHGGNGSEGKGGVFEPDGGGDGGSGSPGGDGGYCFMVKTYEILIYNAGILDAGSAGNGGNGGTGGDGGNSFISGASPGGIGGNGGDAGKSGDIGLTGPIEGNDKIAYVGSLYAQGGSVGLCGYDGDGERYDVPEYRYAGDSSSGLLFGQPQGKK